MVSSFPFSNLSSNDLKSCGLGGILLGCVCVVFFLTQSLEITRKKLINPIVIAN